MSKRHPVRIRKLIEALRFYQPECVYLFGSWARGEGDALSDLDVVVIKRTATSFFERLQAVARLLPVDVGGVDILVYTPEEFATMRRSGNALAETVVEEAQVIYGRPAEN